MSSGSIQILPKQLTGLLQQQQQQQQIASQSSVSQVLRTMSTGVPLTVSEPFTQAGFVSLEQSMGSVLVRPSSVESQAMKMVETGTAVQDMKLEGETSGVNACLIRENASEMEKLKVESKDDVTASQLDSQLDGTALDAAAAPPNPINRKCNVA